MPWEPKPEEELIDDWEVGAPLKFAGQPMGLGLRAGVMPTAFGDVLPDEDTRFEEHFRYPAEPWRGGMEEVPAHRGDPGAIERGGDENRRGYDEFERNRTDRQEASLPSEPTETLSYILSELFGIKPAEAGMRVPTKPFFSAAAKAIEDAPLKAAPASQWLGTLLNTPGIKKEELDWIGVEDWLKAQKKPVTKEEIHGFVQSNQVDVQEVVKGDMKFAPSKYNIPEVRRIAQQAGDTPGDLELTLANDGDAYRALTRRFPELAENEDWASIVAQDVFRGDTKPPDVTKFSRYQLPGGENYRELLLTLPSKDVSGGTQPGAVPWSRNTIAEQTRLRETTEFRSGHYDEPNVLAHVRFNDRVSANGEKTLFIEEIQSDWHQKGRKGGYPKSTKGWKAKSLSEPGAHPHWEITDGDGNYVTKIVGGNEESAISKAAEGAVPDAPFKTTWPELSLKRMIKWAADNGYDSISWTPGKVQAARYDLSKQVDSIKAHYDTPAAGRGGVMVEIRPRGDTSRNGIRLQVDANGKVDASLDTENLAGEDARVQDIANAIRGGQFEGKTLDEVVGKEIAEKIIKDAAENKMGWSVKNVKSGNWGPRFATKAEANEYYHSLPETTRMDVDVMERVSKASKEYRGLDLQIGGEGMNAFYDKMLVNTANKLGKKYGAKVGVTKVKTDFKAAEWADAPEGGRVLDRSNPGWKEEEVWSLPITDKLREAAQKGFPLFTAAGVAGGALTAESGEAEAGVRVPSSVTNAAIKELTKQIPGLKGIVKYLTEDELVKVKAQNAQKIVDIFESMPNPEEMAAVAFAGRAKRGWYRQSAKALLEIFGIEDAPRFAALLAGTSPQTSVESNAINALNIWKNWDAAGRPTGREEIIEIMGASVQGGKGVDSVLPAWINNSVDALSHEMPMDLKFDLDLSGPKVNSFMQNLRDNVNEVTLDAWMANYANVNQELFRKTGPKPGKGFGYIGTAAAVRKAAEVLTKKTGDKWTPAEIQETIWSWAKTLYEKVSSGNIDYNAEQLLRAGGLTHEDIASTPDFEVLFVSGVYRKLLEAAGYGKQLETVEKSLAGRSGSAGRSDGEKPTGSILSSEGSGFTRPSFERHLERAAKRLDELRAKRDAESVKKKPQPKAGAKSKKPSKN